MQRLPKIEKENASGDLMHFYGAVTGLLGRVPNFYRTLSHAPWLAMLLLLPALLGCTAGGVLGWMLRKRDDRAL